MQVYLSKFLNCIFGPFTELFELSFSAQIGDGWLGMVSRSQLVHQFLNFGHSSLIFNYRILWNSLTSEINFKWILILRNKFPCAPCAAVDALVLLRYGFPGAPQCLAAAVVVAAALMWWHPQRSGRPLQQRENPGTWVYWVTVVETPDRFMGHRPARLKWWSWS